MENSSIRKGWALALLPALILPFLTLGFWALGGGSGHKSNGNPPSGLDMELPEAHLKFNPGEDKLSFYEEAQRDSDKFRKEESEDPLIRSFPKDKVSAALLNDEITQGPGTEKIYEKISALNRQLQEDAVPDRDEASPIATPPIEVKGEDRLEDLMHQFNRDSGKDPQLSQLSTLMDKILAMEHPGSGLDTERGSTGSINKNSLPVLTVPGGPRISRLEKDTLNGVVQDTLYREQTSVRFYSDSGPGGLMDVKSPPLWAAVYGNQTLVSGEVIRMRLLNSLEIQGHLIPRNCLLYGVTTLSEERLLVRMNAIEYMGTIFPVSLNAFDLDGICGINIPGATTRDQVKESSGDAFQNMGYGSLDPSLGAQAAGASIQAAKNLITKKVKLVRVNVKSGYLVLLQGNIAQPY